MSPHLPLLRATFPQLEITVGYIGNCDLGNKVPRWDDRRWLVFTNLREWVDLYSQVQSVSIDIPGPEFDVQRVIKQIQARIDRGVTTSYPWPKNVVRS